MKIIVRSVWLATGRQMTAIGLRTELILNKPNGLRIDWFATERQKCQISMWRSNSNLNVQTLLWSYKVQKVGPKTVICLSPCLVAKETHSPDRKMFRQNVLEIWLNLAVVLIDHFQSQKWKIFDVSWLHKKPLIGYRLAEISFKGSIGFSHQIFCTSSDWALTRTRNCNSHLRIIWRSQGLEKWQ